MLYHVLLLGAPALAAKGKKGVYRWGGGGVARSESRGKQAFHLPGNVPENSLEKRDHGLTILGGGMPRLRAPPVLIGVEMYMDKLIIVPRGEQKSQGRLHSSRGGGIKWRGRGKGLGDSHASPSVA